MNPPVGILIVGHGSPRAHANDGFLGLVGRVASRLSGAVVLPAFFSIARPNIADQCGVLVAQGVRQIVLLPYFLYTGQHVAHDIPELLAECGRQHPGLTFKVLPTLENEPALEDLVVDRLALFATAGPLPTDGRAIEQRSLAIIDRQLGPADSASLADRIIRRVVHATADFGFAHSMRVHADAAASGLAALAAGKPIVCDVNMLKVGITKAPGEVLCAVSDADVVRAAAEGGITRAAAAMEKLAGRLDGTIVAIGNAPTALFKVIELASRGVARPALVVGLPIGFVGAAESKLALTRSDLCYITNVGPRGGSPAAAAAVNALVKLHSQGETRDASE